MKKQTSQDTAKKKRPSNKKRPYSKPRKKSNSSNYSKSFNKYTGDRVEFDNQKQQKNNQNNNKKSYRKKTSSAPKKQSSEQTSSYSKKQNSEPQENKKPYPGIEKGKLRIIPLGGCEEVGRNMTVFEYEDDIIIVDVGMQFPEEDMPGIDYIIPNTDYLKDKKHKIKAVIFTHGHLDHIGAAPIILEKIGNPQIIASNLTIHMIKARLEDYKKGSAKNVKARIIQDYGEKIALGNFKIRFFPVTHSIMDALGVLLETPAGTIIHPGDWQLEAKKENRPFDYAQLSKLKKPTLLMLESLGVNYKSKPVPPEEMYKNIENIISGASGRVIIATFSSMIERIKVVLEMAEKYNKKVAVDGFSMKSNVEIAKKVGYIKFNLKNLIDVSKVNKYDDKNIIVLCAGAQGEENSALSRIANGEHRFINFKKSDTIIFSSSVIPGNERTVQRLKDLVYRQSDNVIHSEIMDVHSGGHATAADIEEMLKMIQPTFFIPVYANHYMLKEAAKLAKSIGYKDKNVIVPDNGSVIEIDGKNADQKDKKVETSPVFVDGLGVSNLQNVVLRDRQILSEDGMVVVIATISSRRGILVHSPDIISRGFVYLKENRELIDGTRKKVRNIIDSQQEKVPVQDDYLKNKIRNDVGQFLFSKTGKRPMILPVVIEV